MSLDDINAPVSPETFACIFHTELEHVHVDFVGVTGPDGRVVQDYPTRAALELLERLVHRRDENVRADERAKIVERLREREAEQRELCLKFRNEAITLKARGEDWSATFDAECVSESKRMALKDAADLIEREGGGNG